jgi:hypothetical protein
VAFSALAGCLPEDERAAAVDEVLTAYTPSAHWDERDARVLGQLARASPTERLTQAIREFLSRKPPLTDDALEELAPGLPETLIEEAFRYALSDKFAPVRALAKLAPRLNGALLTQAIAHASQEGSGNAVALTALARQLPHDSKDHESVLAMALEAAVRWPLNTRLDGVMADLIPQLPEQLRPRAVSAALQETCSDLKSCQQANGEEFDRLRAVLAVLRVPELKQFYTKLGQEVQVPRVRARAQAAVLKQACDQHAADFFDSGQTLHHDWPGVFDRAGLMDLTAATAWWIDQQGGSTDVDEIVQAIFDVTRWWP